MTIAARLAVHAALWRAFGDQWPRIPPERRARAWRAMSLSLAACIVVGVVLILQPWGAHTVVWVILGGGGVMMVLLLAGVTAQAIIDVRRARKRRAEKT